MLPNERTSMFLHGTKKKAPKKFGVFSFIANLAPINIKKIMKTPITIGLVVMYHLTSEDIEKGIKLSPSKRYPAIINSIDDDGTCNLTVFGKDQRFDRSTKHFSDCENGLEGSFSLQGEQIPVPVTEELEHIDVPTPAPTDPSFDEEISTPTPAPETYNEGGNATSNADANANADADADANANQPIK